MGQEPDQDLQPLSAEQPARHGGFRDYTAPTTVRPAGKPGILGRRGPPSSLAKTQLPIAGSLSNYCPSTRWHSHHLSLQIHPKAPGKARDADPHRKQCATSVELRLTRTSRQTHSGACCEIRTGRADPLPPRSQPAVCVTADSGHPEHPRQRHDPP